MRFLLLAFLFSLVPVSAQEALKRIAEIRALSPEVAALKRPVRLEVTVTFYDPVAGSFFVSDEEHGVFVAIDYKHLPSPQPKPGDRLRIEGHTQDGDFIPNVAMTRMERLGSGPLLAPRSVSAADLHLPELDCEWCEVRAVIKGTAVDSAGALYLDLLAEGWPVKAYVSRAQKFQTPPWQLIGRSVRLRCVVATRFNQQRQMCGRQLMVPNLEAISFDDDVSPRGIPPRRLSSELLRVSSAPREKVQMQGVVTMLRPGRGFTLRDEGGSIFARTAQPLDFKIGDVVELQGFAELSDFRPNVNVVEVQHLRPGPAPASVPLDVAARRNSREQQELVSLPAQLAEVFHTGNQIVFRCIAENGKRFDATLASETPLDFQPGSRLQLTGICELQSSNISEKDKWADGFQLHLRAASDIAILATPSWWTAGRLARLAAIVAAIAALIGLWAIMLKKQVRAQSAIIREQTERTATLDERHRIARELHDTLEQDLMGVTMLLEDTAERLQNTAPEAGERLAIARRLLRRSREESRSTIRDLRSVALEQLGLPAAIADTLQPIAEAAGLDFTFTTEGSVRKLPALAESSILRIAHEALANAVKHAAAKRIRARLEFTAQTTRLEITDDGHGFTPDEVDARAGHFGLQGIRERTNKLGGTLQITSQPGSGTTISVSIPV